MNKSQKGFTVIEGLLIVVILAIIGGTGYYVWHAKNNANNALNSAVNTTQTAPKVTAIKTFADCQKATGSITQQSYPEVCVTKSGQRFTNPNQTVSDSASWVALISAENAFTVKVPDGWDVVNYGGANMVRAVSVSYAKGQSAKIETAASPYAGDSPTAFEINLVDNAGDYAAPQGTRSDFSIGTKEGYKYYQYFNEDSDPGPGQVHKGDISYTYDFDLGSNKALIIDYFINNGGKDQSTLVDQVVQSIQLN